MGHLKFVRTIQVKVIIFLNNSLKMQNYLWGIRNIEEVCNEGKKNGFLQEDIISMPANNFSIIYRKISF